MKRKIAKLTAVTAAVFIVLTVLFCIYFAGDSQMAEEIIRNFQPTLEEVTAEDGTISYIGLVRNNVFACAVCMGLGFIPFLFLPLFAVLSNTLTAGSVLGYSASAGLSPLKLTVFGLLPHGIFELPAVFLAIAMGLYLCRTLTLKILGKAKEDRILPMLNWMAKTFVLVIIPLIIIAAVVECMVTPVLLQWAGI